MNIGANITGSGQLSRRLSTLANEIKREIMKEIIETAMVDIETVAKRNCRVDTGRLRSSIHVEYKGHNENFDYRDSQGNAFDGSLQISIPDDSVYVGTNVEYAHIIERNYPFLFPAIEASRPKLKMRIQRVLTRI